MTLIFSVLLLLQPNWTADINSWGIGILSFQKEANAYANRYQLPLAQKLPYFDGPNGKFAGYLLFQPPNEDLPYQEFYAFPLSEERQIVSQNDFQETGYEVSSLLVFERRNNWIKVLHHTLKGGKWVNLEGLKAHDLQFVDWLQFLVDNHHAYYPSEYGLNLRKGPGVSHERLFTVKGDLYRIQLTGKTALGLWAEVNVEEYNKHPCDDGELTGKKWTGWIKVLDDTGYPNIWFDTRGC
ncbi:MAG: hypothetical protein AB8H47_29945 [Bacteroidia bacterium]